MTTLTVQQELPLARIGGEAFTKLPKDLYIPPNPLEVTVDAFEGPLDLLLYLIKRQNIDILDINVADIAEQYMAYVELMQASQFELAADYLVMAATLAEIKSRMLLPRRQEEDAGEEDNRMELIRRLQEYEQIQQAAVELDRLPRMERDTQPASVALPPWEKVVSEPEVVLDELLICLSRVLRQEEVREQRLAHHHVQLENLSTGEKMTQIQTRLSRRHFIPWVSLLLPGEGRLGVVVTFLAVMELMKESLVEVVQPEPFGPIQLKGRPGSADGAAPRSGDGNRS